MLVLLFFCIHSTVSGSQFILFFNHLVNLCDFFFLIDQTELKIPTRFTKIILSFFVLAYMFRNYISNKWPNSFATQLIYIYMTKLLIQQSSQRAWQKDIKHLCANTSNNAAQPPQRISYQRHTSTLPPFIGHHYFCSNWLVSLICLNLWIWVGLLNSSHFTKFS